MGWSFYFEHPHVVLLLLEKGARMRLPSRWGSYNSLLDLSCGLSTSLVSEVLLEFYVRGKHEDGLTPPTALIAALQRDDSSLVKLILDVWFDSDTDKYASVGDALHYAVALRNLEFLKQLLEHAAEKATVNEVVSSRGTPLNAAILAGADSKIISLLLQARGQSRHRVRDIWDYTQLRLHHVEPRSYQDLSPMWKSTKVICERAFEIPWRPSEDSQGLTILHYAAVSKSAQRVADILNRCSEEGLEARIDIGHAVYRGSRS